MGEYDRKIVFFFTILLCQKSNFPKDSHPSDGRQLHCSYLLKTKKKRLEPFVLLEGFPFGDSVTKSHQQIYCAVEQTLLMITSDLRQN